ncbi:hypothetical protein ASPBRDRAFT_199189 [Aspergillus brasiliensis CBS 101740]|uniref:25S rRNA (uridine-N(3))-methyltransferase BMT5-like domain-containing protein n=1 Tax=Aspergillus brasiliensis (strain CBS 101740 / IMI 381727 / IBT 21946) TaxID=767769 RepID=A0A1L9UAY5_ASPBC|nr:hypothetical protein ASPBRDRAFT_199189 [Aspergillus brasiliensis CBS 101740]
MSSFAKLSTTTTTTGTNSAKPNAAQGGHHHHGSGNASKNSNNDRKMKHSQQQQQQQQQRNQRPIVPFGRMDRILLVGEGDFSFARSLVLQHRCKNVMATCYDSKDTLYSKYPKAEKNIHDIQYAFSKATTGEHASDISGNFPNGGDAGIGGTDSQESLENQAQRRGAKVLYSVDARKLGLPAGGGKEIRTGFPRQERKRPAWKEAKSGASSAPQGGPWDVICFNFPHVGGISTDVNRQVRANQELLVAFFKACVPLLSHRPEYVDSDDEDDWDNWEDSELESSGGEDDHDGSGDGNQLRTANTTGQATCRNRVEPGQILVSMFEGEPYTLWNIKDLARHAGLQVVTSFRFPWASYKEYSHARTLGNIEGKDGGRGGWRGEDRDARMYVFEVKQEDHPAIRRNAPSSKPGQTARKKRPRDASDSDDSE